MFIDEKFPSPYHDEKRKSSIEICDNAIIGTDVNIITAKIGKGAVIAAGALVTHDVPPYEVWAGFPAKKLMTREEFNKKSKVIYST